LLSKLYNLACFWTNYKKTIIKTKMKKISILLCAVMFFSSFTKTQDLNDVINGIKIGNAAYVSKYFDNTVEISVSGKSNNYSKSQGEAVLRDFFTTHAVKGFNIIHVGESGNSRFCIGTLLTKNGVYRTTINLKQNGNKQILQEIKFEN
jgi:Domain of unknown function (DUF4783)